MELDSTYLKQVRSDEANQYLSELSEVTEKSNESPTHISRTDITSVTTPLGIVLIIAVVCFVLYRFLVKLDTHVADEEEPLGMGNDTIVGHDWEEEIKSRMLERNYSEAAVLFYLRWLDQLNSDGVIHFTVAKTPGIFLQEVKDYSDPVETEEAKKARIDKTMVLTHHYLRIRYGHRKADAQLIEELKAL